MNVQQALRIMKENRPTDVAGKQQSCLKFQLNRQQAFNIVWDHLMRWLDKSGPEYLVPMWMQIRMWQVIFNRVNVHDFAENWENSVGIFGKGASDAIHSDDQITEDRKNALRKKMTQFISDRTKCIYTDEPLKVTDETYNHLKTQHPFMTVHTVDYTGKETKAPINKVTANPDLGPKKIPRPQLGFRKFS